MPFQPRQVPRREGCLGQPDRRDTPVLGPPPVSGLASNPDSPTRLDGADAAVEQSPVFAFESELSLASTSSHSHTPYLAGVLRRALEPKCRLVVSFRLPLTASEPNAAATLRSGSVDESVGAMWC